MKPIEVLLLSRTDVTDLALSTTDVVSAVEKALLEHAAGTYEMHPKIGVHPTGTDPANFIHAMPAYLHPRRLWPEVGSGVCQETIDKTYPT